MSKRFPLPVDAILPELLHALEQQPNVVLEAAPGAGKTTRVPAALLHAVSGDVLVLEPRRIAARFAARRVAEEMGEQVGETVGYQVRFEERVSAKTRLRFVTEGILNRRLLSDPELRGVDVVVLDEFHERHLETDLALALLKRLQQRRPSLRIVVMSATLDAAPVATFLDDCVVLRSEGRAYPLEIEFGGYTSKPLETQLRDAVERLAKEDREGNILVFLPGQAEIRRAMRECEDVARRYALTSLALHGSLTPAEQDRVVAPSRERKVIFATNVAESSVTVDGVNAVIDSGLARVASYSPWTGLPQLRIARVSKASAIQRAGRAGRQQAGRALRLYVQEDFALRAEHETPEILRADLSQLLLSLRAMGVERPSELQWLDEPPADAVNAAEALLDALGAHGKLAERMARLPLSPRLARVVLAAEDRGIADLGCRAAALLGAGIPLQQNDLLQAMDAHAGKQMDARVRQQYEHLCRAMKRAPATYVHHDEALLLSLLTGFPDRVGKRRIGKQIGLANGVAAELAGEHPQGEFFLALDAEDRAEQALPLVRTYARIEPEMLLEVFPERVIEQSVVEWNRNGERAEKVSTLLFDKLVIEETRGPASAEDAARLLAEKALQEGIERFVDAEALANLRERVAFAGFEALDEAAALRELAYGLKSFAQLRDAAKASLLHVLEAQVDARKLSELAPTSIRLSSGRQTKVHYEHDRAPWIGSRLQDFFGMKETPRIGPARTPVVVHLLAPNQRAVQTTTDLAGFWERLYPTTRKELMRRYPRHAWPENPHAPVEAKR
ncbi:ATP-dependent helicase HrpB [Granulicella cerasi]|uniref:ATP-dependent helicase HrpB n=1 Tax=Granulicella cerasi TaxID=741063 RepID=A0ABW1Z9J6_9BACT|nr:ATP-dependent helicase HrpB [Granulicella cerasi]